MNTGVYASSNADDDTVDLAKNYGVINTLGHNDSVDIAQNFGSVYTGNQDDLLM